MSKEQKTATFAAMVRASLGHGLVDGVTANAQGGTFRLPLERAAVIEADDVAPGRERVLDGVEWLRGDSDESPVLSRLMIVPTSQTRGKVASGAVLPMTSMQPESGTSALGRGIAFPTTPSPALGDLFTFTADASGITAIDEDGAALTAAETDETYRFNGTAWQRQASTFGEHDFDLSSTIEAKSEISLQLAVQTGDTVLDDVLEAHRLGLADRLLEQVLSGDGVGSNLAGVASATGIGSATYLVADRGSDEAFTDGELAVEDGGGRSPYMAWALGRDLDTSAQKTAVEPGASRRVLEGGRLTLSGLPAQRIVEGLGATVGLVADFRTIVVPVLSEIIVVVDRVTLPGYVRLTSRLPLADPIVTHPSAVYRLSQA